MHWLIHGRRTTGWIGACVIAALAPSPLAAYEDQIRDESRYLAGKIAEQGKIAAAVIDFTDLDGGVTHLGRFMAEELSIALATESRSFRVVDRTHIRSLLKEHKLSSSGLIDPDTARELGRIAGVDTLVNGTVTPLGDSIRLSIKVLDSETAQVIASSSSNIPKTQAIDSLLRRGVATSGGGAAPSSPAAGGGASSPTVEKSGIAFALQGCQRSNETVTCRLILTNQAKDQTAYLNSKATRLIDHFGNELYASSIFLGSSSHPSYVNRTLVKGVSMNAGAVFEGLATEVRRLALLEVDFYYFTIQFKDVPIS